ncbi:MAG: hypothetical protein AB7O97_19515 [Planctomycetota bacterium]
MRRTRLPLAAWLCLLALAIRLLLPVMHTHAHCAAATSAATTACTCGAHHGDGMQPAPPTRAQSTDDLAGLACACFACELEHGVPGAPPPRHPSLRIANAAVASLRAPPMRAASAVERADRHSRAPPTGRRRFVASA